MPVSPQHLQVPSRSDDAVCPTAKVSLTPGVLGQAMGVNAFKWTWTRLRATTLDLNSSASCQWVSEQLSEALHAPSAVGSFKAHFRTVGSTLVGGVNEEGFVAYLRTETDLPSTGAIRPTIHGRFIRDAEPCQCECTITASVVLLLTGALLFGVLSIAIFGIGAWVVIVDHPHSLGYALMAIGAVLLLLTAGFTYMQANIARRNEEELLARLQALLR